MISKRCTYGLQAMQYLASHAPDGSYVPVRTIGAHYGISQSFLTKILQDLCRKGWVESYRGPKGGVRLVQPADSISLIDVILALDGPNLLEACVLGFRDCNRQNPCPMHESWVPVQTGLEQVLTEHTIATLVEIPPGVERGGYRALTKKTQNSIKSN